MLNRFLQFITEQHLFAAGQEVLLAVSGGRDSVVLCHLMQRAGYRYTIAHCNFHLRPGDCDRDEIFVRQLAQQHGVPCHVAQFYTRDTAVQAGTGIEEQARAERYGFFSNLLQQHGYACVATAHHQDDSIETFFLNLLRGTGIGGLHGIRPISSGPKEMQGSVVHPLLGFSRADINSYVAEHHLSYVEDYTNRLPDYRRNRIRLQLLPMLRELSPTFDSTMAANIRRFADAEILYRQAVESCRHELLQPLDGDAANGRTIPLEALLRLQPQRTLLYELLSPFGFSLGVVDDVIEGLPRNARQEFHSTTHRLCRERDQLVVQPLALLADAGKVIPLPLIPPTADPCEPNRLPLPSAILCWSVTTRNPLQEAMQPIKLPPSQACFDLDKLMQPLHLRHWREGDKFCPFGMKGSKLVSDYFSDNKFTQRQKETTWLLCDAADHILWIAGHRATAVAPIAPHTCHVILFSLQQE